MIPREPFHVTVSEEKCDEFRKKALEDLIDRELMLLQPEARPDKAGVKAEMSPGSETTMRSEYRVRDGELGIKFHYFLCIKFSLLVTASIILLQKINREKSVTIRAAKIILLILLHSAFALSAGRAYAQAYNVSGVVDFSYHNFETRTGNVKSSDAYFIQSYQANLQSFLWDPRFLTFNAGAGYSLYNNMKSGADSRNLIYDLHASFFPGRMIAWDLFGSKADTTIQSTSNLAGYDTTLTTYGGTLYLRLGSNRGGGNNNNGSNDNFSRISLPLPDITLSHIHYNSESLTPANPIRETRDNTNAGFAFRFNPGSLALNAGIEKYENLINGSAYDTRTGNLSGKFSVTSDVDLSLLGNVSDRETENIAGFATDEKVQQYDIVVDAKEKNNLKQSYRYDFSRHTSDTIDYSAQLLQSLLTYRVTDDLTLKGTLDYKSEDYLQKALAGVPEQQGTLQSGSLLGGVAYRKTYLPSFLSLFSFNTAYELKTGFTRISSGTGGPTGSGWYYSNDAGFDLSSRQWAKENMTIGYNYFNQRDNSPVENDIRRDAYRFTFNSRRIRQTVITARLDYTSQMNRCRADAVFLTNPGNANTLLSGQQNRMFTYDLNAAYTATAYLELAAGATRAQTTSTVNTLSTLPTSPSLVLSEDDILYAQANISYQFMRNLLYRANLREEYRSTQTTEIRDHQVNMNLDYRFRQIFINFEYRWREDIPKETLRTFQQYYFVKLSRPF